MTPTLLPRQHHISDAFFSLAKAIPLTHRHHGCHSASSVAFSSFSRHHVGAAAAVSLEETSVGGKRKNLRTRWKLLQVTCGSSRAHMIAFDIPLRPLSGSGTPPQKHTTPYLILSLSMIHHMQVTRLRRQTECERGPSAHLCRNQEIRRKCLRR
jgi:hypothetical protein